jgi:hypothetical protein
MDLQRKAGFIMVSAWQLAGTQQRLSSVRGKNRGRQRLDFTFGAFLFGNT